jgi:flagellar assembly protein FliH
MNSSPDLTASANVRAWIPVELDAPLPRLEYSAALVDLEPLPLRALNTLGPGPDRPSPAEIKPSEAGKVTQAWTPTEIARSPLIPFNAWGADLERFEGHAMSEIQEKILRKAQLEAEEILAAAQRKAEGIFRQSLENAEAIAVQAREEIIAGGRAEVSGLLCMANQIVTEVQSWQEGVLRQGEDLVVALVQDIAAKLFGDGLALEPGRLEKVFERSLAEAKSLGDLRIRAHPEDVAALDELWPVRQTAIRGQKIEMVPDQDIQRGSCYIDGQFGSVDGRVETQLRMVERKLEGVLEEGRK